MRVFLTGGTGYVGSHIVAAMSNHDVTVFSRAGGVELDDVSFVGHDVLIHNALRWGDPGTEWEDFRIATRIFERAACDGVRHIVYTSSTAVHRPFRANMNERDALRPTDLYGAIKAANEMALCAIAASHGIRANVLRLAPVVGAPISRFKSDRRFIEMAAAARRGEPIRVVAGDGRQFVGARDAARAFASLVESDLAGETILCAAENFKTWESVARQIVAVLGSKSEVVAEGEAPPHRFDVAKLERSLGLRFDSRAAVTEHIAYIAETWTDEGA